MAVSDVGDPSGPELELIQLANRARRDPVAEGVRYGVSCTGIPATPPLAPNTLLAKAALGHCNDMSQNHYYAHVNPTTGQNPGQQISAAGYTWMAYGQNIDTGPVQPVDAKVEHERFFVDVGNNPPGHRYNILGYQPTGPQPGFREMGTSYITNQIALVGADWDHYITEDFGTDQLDKPFVTGVVFDDKNASGEYDAGEGVGGVVIKLRASDQTWVEVQSSSAGAYSFRVNDPGDYTLEMSGGPFTTAVTLKITVGTDNVQVDAVVGIGLVKR
jgi:hypothetical protein